jgi:hypothetical protein
MRKILALLFALLSAPALGQSYPSPTYDNLTVNLGLFFNSCSGIVVGQGPAAAVCQIPVSTAYLPVGTSGATIPLMSTINTWTGLQTFPLIAFSGHPYGTGTAPGVSSCGTSPSISTGANDVHGTVTTGTASPTSCTITWAAARTNTPDCSVDSPSGTTVSSFSPTASTLVINFPGTSSAKFTYVCMGQ